MGVKEGVTANAKDRFLKLQERKLFLLLCILLCITEKKIEYQKPEAVALHVCVVCMYVVACALRCVCGVY